MGRLDSQSKGPTQFGCKNVVTPAKTLKDYGLTMQDSLRAQRVAEHQDLIPVVVAKAGSHRPLLPAAPDLPRPCSRGILNQTPAVWFELINPLLPPAPAISTVMVSPLHKPIQGAKLLVPNQCFLDINISRVLQHHGQGGMAQK